MPDTELAAATALAVAAAAAPAQLELSAASPRRALRDLPRLATRIFGVPLMVSQPKLDVILGALGPRLGIAGAAPLPLLAMEDDEAGATIAAEPPPLYDLGADGIAVIAVEGTLVYKAGWLGALSGLTGYGALRQALDAAIADPKVAGILLAVDSYGGEVNGCFDLSDAIFAARAVKPIYGVAADDAYSAGYALLSAAETIFVSRTSGVGSIGVVALHVDQSDYDAQIGVKYTYIHAGAHKVDGNPHEPLAGAVKAAIQAECDRTRDLFVASVARYRGMAAETLTAMEAAYYLGDAGVKAGLADAVGTPDDARAALLIEIQRRAVAAAAAAASPAPAPAPADPAAAETAKPGNVVDFEAVRIQVLGESAAGHAEIVDLCALAGVPAKAADFIRNKASLEAVRKTLQENRAAASDASATTGRIMPDAGHNATQAIGEGWAAAHAKARGISFAP